MIHMLGAVMVAAGCIWLGNRKARQLTARVRALEALKSALELMQRELELRLTPLPQLMRALSAQTSSPARELFTGCGRALEALEHERLSDAWTRLVGQVPELKEEDRQALAPLGQVLGRYDGRGQAAAIEAVSQELEGLKARAQEESSRLGRVYRALGAAGGGFLVILLL